MPATAPYNFIRFVPPVTAKGLNGGAFELPAFDVDVPGLNSGYIDYTLTTLSPLHIGPDSASLKTPDGKYYWVPGSAVRGMLRSVLESVLGSELDEPVLKAQHDAPVSYRAPLAASAAYKNAYWGVRRTTINEQTVGLLRRDSNGGYAITTGDRFKVHRGLLGGYRRTLLELTLGRPAPLLRTLDAGAAKELQFSEIWFIPGPDGTTSQVDPAEFPGARRGWLLITGVFEPGTVQTHAYIVAERAHGTVMSVPSDVIADYKATRTDHTRAHVPDLEEYLAKADDPARPIPVFYDADGAEVKRIGTAGGFRIKAVNNVSSTIDPRARSKGALLAVAALFGRVAADLDPSEAADPLPTIAARVRFGHAMADAAKTPLLSAQQVRLDNPKLTATHLRLRDASSPNALRTFDSEVVAYRGRTIYLHRWDREGSDELKWQAAVREHAAGAPANAPATEASEFRVQPVGSSSMFRGRIEFRNLTDAELGAVVFALRLLDPPGRPATHAHKIGGLRPLGLGSVVLQPSVAILDVQSRYGSAGSGLRTLGDAELQGLWRGFLVPFMGENSVQAPAIRDLEVATRWEGRRPRVETREMSVREHSERELLPTLQELFRG